MCRRMLAVVKIEVRMIFYSCIIWLMVVGGKGGIVEAAVVAVQMLESLCPQKAAIATSLRPLCVNNKRSWVSLIRD